MKRPFEEIVEENADWIYRYVRSKTADRETAEDLAQEVWLRAFRAYDTYEERGMLRHWLARIASNIVRNALFGRPDIVVFSLDAAAEDEDPILSRLADREIPDPLDEVERREMIASVLSAIDSLPDKYRQVMTFRFLMDLPVDEVARRMNIPAGSVKSSTHYAIERIRRDLGIPEKEKGETTMTCEKAKNYLLTYAKGKVMPETAKEIKAHLEKCPRCRDMEESLETLVPMLELRADTFTNTYSITFPREGIDYGGFRFDSGKTVENRYNTKYSCLKALFGRNGEEIPFEPQEVEGMEEQNCVMIHPKNGEDGLIRMTAYTSVIPDEFRCRYERNFGSNGYHAFYCAVPKSFGMPKIIQGNGVVIPEKGGYNFAYVGRFAACDEIVVLSFELD